jgi:hypothetical protein
MNITGVSSGAQTEAGRMTTDSSCAVTGGRGRAIYGCPA